MKTHKLFLVTTLFAFATGVSAQDYAFKVLANKGNNEIKSGASWQALKTGAVLNAGDEVKLGDNAYVGLVHNTGKPIEVKKAGVHKVSDLETQVPVGSSVLNKYTDFILSSSEGKTNRLSATGAVTRDITDAGAIRLFLPDNDHSGIFEKTAVVNWDGGNAKGPYVITIINMFEDVLEKAEVAETTFTIDLSNPKYAQENAILIEVAAKSAPGVVSKRHMIKKISPAESAKISAELEQIKGEVTEETALNKLILAGFFEDNGLLIDATTAYEQAVKLQPEAYKPMYEDFLVRNGLK